MKSLTEILIYGAWLVSLTFTLLLFLQCICLKYIHKSCSLKYFPLSKFLDNDYVLLSAFLFFFFGLAQRMVFISTQYLIT